MKKKKYKYEIALSFASEQREYVKKVSECLKTLGIKHFYDYDNQEYLWGKDLPQALDKIYFEESEYFVPFLSKEYLKKSWTKLELRSALERNMVETEPDFQQYVLPVKYDDVRVPGLPNSIAFINAKDTSPEQLANKIYKKIRGKLPQIVNSDKNEIETDYMLPDYNEKINVGKLMEMKAAYENIDSTHAFVVYGEKGLGKKVCIQRFLAKKDNVIKITPNFESQYQFESIIYAMKLDTAGLDSDYDLEFKEKVRKEFLSYCQKNKPIIYIVKFDEFDVSTSSLLIDLLETLLIRYSDLQTILIFEFDTDEMPQLINHFYRLPPNHIDFIHFKKLSNDEIKPYFFDAVKNIQISKDNLNYILDSSLGNIMYLNVIINFLRNKGLIHKFGSGIICDDLPQGILSNALKDYIMQRYERLDDTMKEVISKSSIIGNKFETDWLSKPFGIINANELLEEIEEISKLITNSSDNVYSFESRDVYNLIKKKVPENMQKEWHQILANYFERSLDKEKKRKIKIDIKDEISKIYPIAKHYKYAHNYIAAIKYYIDLIAKYEDISDYQHELEALADIRFMLDNIDEFSIDKFNIDEFEYNILKSEANCHKQIGNFHKAYELYGECFDNLEVTQLSDEIFEITFQQSYCLFMDGKVDESLNILLDLKNKFVENQIFDVNYIKTIAFLSSVYDVIGNFKEQKDFYICAINYYKEKHMEQEYYVMLRMASMIFGEELAIGMYEEAEKFFRQRQSIRNLAEVLHNKATDLLYLNRLAEVDSPLTESIKLFDSFGSKAVHYPLNTSGILKMVMMKDYENAIDIFETALQYDVEIFSQITLRINILNCLNLLGEKDKALNQLNQIDSLIDQPNSQSTSVYAIYHYLNWAFYYFHLKDYNACLKEINKCSKLAYMEARYKYVYKSLAYYAKKSLGIKSRNMAGTAPNKIFETCVKTGFYITTLRFYESV